MQRRTFVSGLLLLGGGGLAGHYLPMLSTPWQRRSTDPKAFAEATKGVRMQWVSDTLLLKLFSRQVTDHDRHAFVAEVVKHNRNLFVMDAHSKRHGVPGFYRVTE